MRNTEVSIHDAAEALASLPVTMPNRIDIFKSTMQSLVRLALSERALEMVQGHYDATDKIRNDSRQG